LLTDELAVTVTNLRSRRSGERARDVALVLSPAQPGLLVGPNGAGKSSLIRAVAGIGFGHVQFSRPTSVIAANDFFAMDPAFTVVRAVREFEIASGSSPDEMESTRELSQKFGLDGLWSERIRSLSLGTRQKIRLAIVLGQRRTLCLLDEPFRALDASATEILRSVVNAREYRSEFMLITSHQDVVGLDATATDPWSSP
jgi:tungstate transport system ATP-binding protein